MISLSNKNCSSINDFEIIADLGKGSFGSVYKVKRKSDNKIYALKKVRFDQLPLKDKQNSLNEIRILASIDNPHIIAYRDAFYDHSQKCLYLVLEFAPHGDLSKKIIENFKNKIYFTETQILSYTIQIIKGLKVLHEHNIIHRDIKSANIFLFNNDIVKIGDLNVSKVIKTNLHNTQIGTPFYASPEVWNNSSYDYKSDIWSLGCLIYELAALRPPFQGNNLQKVYEKVKVSDYEQISNKLYSIQLNALIFKCLQVNPMARPNCEELLKLISDRINYFNIKLDGSSLYLNILYENYRNSSNTSLKKRIQSSKLRSNTISNNNNEEDDSCSLLQTIKLPRQSNEINDVLPGNKYLTCKKKINIEGRLPKLNASEFRELRQVGLKYKTRIESQENLLTNHNNNSNHDNSYIGMNNNPISLSNNNNNLVYNNNKNSHYYTNNTLKTNNSCLHNVKANKGKSGMFKNYSEFNIVDENYYKEANKFNNILYNDFMKNTQQSSNNYNNEIKEEIQIVTDDRSINVDNTNNNTNITNNNRKNNKEQLSSINPYNSKSKQNSFNSPYTPYYSTENRERKNNSCNKIFQNNKKVVNCSNDNRKKFINSNHVTPTEIHSMTKENSMELILNKVQSEKKIKYKKVNRNLVIPQKPIKKDQIDSSISPYDSINSSNRINSNISNNTSSIMNSNVNSNNKRGKKNIQVMPIPLNNNFSVSSITNNVTNNNILSTNYNIEDKIIIEESERGTGRCSSSNRGERISSREKEQFQQDIQKKLEKIIIDLSKIDIKENQKKEELRHKSKLITEPIDQNENNNNENNNLYNKYYNRIIPSASRINQDHKMKYRASSALQRKLPKFNGEIQYNDEQRIKSNLMTLDQDDSDSKRRFHFYRGFKNKLNISFFPTIEANERQTSLGKKVIRDDSVERELRQPKKIVHVPFTSKNKGSNFKSIKKINYPVKLAPPALINVEKSNSLDDSTNNKSNSEIKIKKHKEEKKQDLPTVKNMNGINNKYNGDSSISKIIKEFKIIKKEV